MAITAAAMIENEAVDRQTQVELADDHDDDSSQNKSKQNPKKCS